MTHNRVPGKWVASALVGGLVWMAGCSGPTEDVRATLCKDLTRSLQPAAESIDWQGNDNTFRRPEYAIIRMRFEVVDKGGTRSTGTSACHYAYEALEDTAAILADPIQAYATLPFAMTIDGRALSDAELLNLVNAEQRRQGRQVLDTLEKGARDMADKVRSSIAQ